MNTIQLLGLPEFCFAHIHSAEQYHHHMPINHSRLEVAYIAEGSLELQFDGTQVTVEKGDIICTNMQSVHLNTDSFHCHHTVGALAEWQEISELNHLLLPTFTRASSQTAEIKDMIDDFIYNGHLYEDFPEKSASAFLNILCKIDTCNRNSADVQYPAGYILVQRAKKYIHRNIQSPITQTDIANHLGITPSYLCNIFKSTEGTSVIKYINTIKLKNIHNLMETKGLKLYDAAAMYGYSDPNYVSYLYKKTFGRSITSKPELSPKPFKQ